MKKIRKKKKKSERKYSVIQSINGKISMGKRGEMGNRMKIYKSGQRDMGKDEYRNDE